MHSAEVPLATLIVIPHPIESSSNSSEVAPTTTVAKPRSNRRGGKCSKNAKEKRKAEQEREEREKIEEKRAEKAKMWADYSRQFPNLAISAATPVFKSNQRISRTEPSYSRKSAYQKHLDRILSPQRRPHGNDVYLGQVLAFLGHRRPRAPTERPFGSMTLVSFPLPFDGYDTTAPMVQSHVVQWSPRRSFASVVRGY